MLITIYEALQSKIESGMQYITINKKKHMHTHTVLSAHTCRYTHTPHTKLVTLPRKRQNIAGREACSMGRLRE